MERKIQIRSSIWKRQGPKRGRDRSSLTNHPSSMGAWVPPPAPSPPPASCTQVVRDNQRALKGLERIAHQVNEVLHHPEQVHRARGHLGTGGRSGSKTEMSPGAGNLEA